jgi:hypothetical protein
MDATRSHDGKRIMLKKVLPEEGPHELQIRRFFSSREVGTNSRNHCVPLLDVIKLPNSSQQLMVTSFLRPFNNPRFQTFGEFVAFFNQLCEVCVAFSESGVIGADWWPISASNSWPQLHLQHVPKNPPPPRSLLRLRTLRDGKEPE